MKKHFAMLLVGLLVSTGAEAIAMFGNSSCGAWVKNSEAKGWATIADKYWLMGYLSGLSAGIGKDVLANEDADSIYLWVDNYCKANPLDNLSQAGNRLELELKTRKGIE